MQRSQRLKSFGPLNAALLNDPLTNVPPPILARCSPSGVSAGIRPSGGSMINEVRRDATPRSSQCGGGDVAEPTCPAVDRSAVATSNSALSASSWRSTWARRAANSSSVSRRRSPNSGGRSNGTLSSAWLVHVPARSGSPHDVRGVGALCWACSTSASALNTPHAARTRVFIVTPSATVRRRRNSRPS